MQHAFDQLYLQLGQAYEFVNEWERARAVYQTLLTRARNAQRAEVECAALNRLVSDREERHRMGAEALASAADYGLEDVTTQWEAFLERRLAERPRRGPLASLFG